MATARRHKPPAVPKGLRDNSPAFQRRECVPKIRVPQGRLKDALIALGHHSEAVHRVYAKKAKVKLPSLEEFENKIVELPVWAVAGSRPNRRNFSYLPPVIPPKMKSGRLPEVWQYEPMEEFEYIEAVKRHDSDPAHNPFPSPVPDHEQ